MVPYAAIGAGTIMTFAVTAAGGGLKYYPCRYGTSRVRFRGPRRDLKGDYVACLGGTETYGLFVPQPFPRLLEDHVHLPCVNLGAINAGLDLFLDDAEVLNIARRARAVVIQITGAQNMSNRMYRVHPRRNDRFVQASEVLMTLFPEVDFTEFAFTRHMLGALAGIDTHRFAMVVTELQEAWIARMTRLVALLGQPPVLVWLARQPPPAETLPGMAVDDPLFITQPMIDRVAYRAARMMVLTASDHALSEGTRGLVYHASDTAAAEGQLGPRAHQDAARALAQVLLPMVKDA